MVVIEGRGGGRKPEPQPIQTDPRAPGARPDLGGGTTVPPIPLGPLPQRPRVPGPEPVVPTDPSGGHTR